MISGREGRPSLETKATEGPTYPEMDRAYFENTANIQHDLAAFAATFTTETEIDNGTGFGEKVTRTVEVARLTGWHFNSKYCVAVCANGERVEGRVYIARAGIALGLARDERDAVGKRTEILDVLKKKIGIREIVDYRDIFRSDEYIVHGLNMFALQAKLGQGLGEGVDRLTPALMRSIEITDARGKKVKGRAFLTHAAVGFGWAATVTEAEKISPNRILSELQRRYSEYQKNIEIAVRRQKEGDVSEA